MEMFEEANIKTDEFSVEELNTFPKNAENEKPQGTDGVPMEFFKSFDEHGRETRLKISNKLWTEEWFLEN